MIQNGRGALLADRFGNTLFFPLRTTTFGFKQSTLEEPFRSYTPTAKMSQTPQPPPEKPPGRSNYPCNTRPTCPYGRWVQVNRTICNLCEVSNVLFFIATNSVRSILCYVAMIQD